MHVFFLSLSRESYSRSMKRVSSERGWRTPYHARLVSASPPRLGLWLGYRLEEATDHWFESALGHIRGHKGENCRLINVKPRALNSFDHLTITTEISLVRMIFLVDFLYRYNKSESQLWPAGWYSHRVASIRNKSSWTCRISRLHTICYL